MLLFEQFGLTVIDIVLLGLTITTLILLVRMSKNLKKHRLLEHSTPIVSSVAKAFREQAEKPEHIRESRRPPKKLEKINSAKVLERKEPSPSSPESTQPSVVARQSERTTQSTSSSSAEPVHPHESVKTLREPEEKTAKPKTSNKKESSHSQECPHYFGYLKTIPDRGSVPDYCLECPSIMRCLFANEEQTAKAQA